MTKYSSEDILKILDNVLDIDSSLRGLAYLKQVCFNIYKHFQVEYIIIGRAVQPENVKVETIVALKDGVLIENFIYELQNSPCENVCETQEVCIYEKNVKTDFHKHSLVTDLNIESYIGSPLMQNKNIFGLLVFLDSDKIDVPAYYQSMIHILASRVSAEIERYINDEMVIVLQKSNLELATKNQLDTLTNTYNRHFFSVHVNKLINEGVKGALLFFDLDDFKIINDTHGHQVGDKVLKNFADTMQDVIRDSDVLARYGGEEFVLFLPNADKDVVSSISDRIHYELSNSQSSIPEVTVSIGAHIMGNTDNLEILIKYADVALYKAKSLGKNQTVFYK